MSLTQALGRAGGLNQVTSNGDEVYVVRGIDAANLASQTSGAGATVYHLGAKSASAFALSGIINSAANAQNNFTD
jgi:polysaccharide biosynthesis/export protein